MVTKWENTNSGFQMRIYTEWFTNENIQTMVYKWEYIKNGFPNENIQRMISKWVYMGG